MNKRSGFRMGTTGPNLNFAIYITNATAGLNEVSLLNGNTPGQTTLTLPATPPAGDIQEIVNTSSVSWTVAAASTGSVQAIDHYTIGGLPSIVIPSGMAMELVAPNTAVAGSWYVVGGGFTPGYLLATQQYAPAVLTSYTVVGGTMTALDTTNATLSFIVPPDGNVDVRAEFTANCTRGAAANNALLIALLDHTSHAVVGYFISVMVNAIVSSTQIVSASRIFNLTGLAPGAKQVDLAAADVTAAGNAAFIYAQGQSSVVSSGVVAPLLLEATAA